MSSASLLERVRIGARADFHEETAPLQQDVAQRAARRLVVGPAGIGEAKELTTLKRGLDSLHTPRQLEMLDTLEVAKDLLGIAVMLAGRPGHIPGECAEGIHDLGYRVDAHVEQFADELGIHGDNILVRDRVRAAE